MTGSRYGGSSRTSVGAGPFSTVRRSTAAAVSAATTDSAYIAKSATAPALRNPTRVPGANTVAVTSTYTGSRALHDVSGSTSIVSSRSVRLSSVRVAITAGTAHEKPESIGTKARPCSPTARMTRSMTKAARDR